MKALQKKTAVEKRKSSILQSKNLTLNVDFTVKPGLK